jgi:hypothetical protein
MGLSGSLGWWSCFEVVWCLEDVLLGVVMPSFAAFDPAGEISGTDQAFAFASLELGRGQVRCDALTATPWRVSFQTGSSLPAPLKRRAILE